MPITAIVETSKTRECFDCTKVGIIFTVISELGSGFKWYIDDQKQLDDDGLNNSEIYMAHFFFLSLPFLSGSAASAAFFAASSVSSFLQISIA